MLLSIIIPLAADENCWKDLLLDLAGLQAQAEFLLVYNNDAALQSLLQFKQGSTLNIHLIRSESGRAKALNAGGNAAKGQFLWFIHADTRIKAAAIKTLLHQIQSTHHEPRLYYFLLTFASNKRTWRWRMACNSLGLNFRSRVLLSPFGDQAFCIDKTSFQQVGTYSETVKYGEDHCLVWACHLQGIAVQALSASISTSPRKYIKGGWIKITLLHNLLWFKQWLPYFLRYTLKHSKHD